MFFLELTRRQETVWASWPFGPGSAPEGTSYDPTPVLVGTLALQTFQDVRPSKGGRADRLACGRLVGYLQKHKALPFAPWVDERRELWNKQVALVRAQLREWGTPGRRTLLQYSNYSEIDPLDGPTDALSNPEGRDLLDAVQWRLPRPGSQFLLIKSPVAAVLLSALEGIAAGSVLVCRDCQAVVRRHPGMRASRCIDCSKRHRDLGRRRHFSQEFVRVMDRVRKNVGPKQPIRRKKQWSDRGERAGKIRDAVRQGALSEKEGVDQLRSLFPVGLRGRPRKRQATRVSRGPAARGR